MAETPEIYGFFNSKDHDRKYNAKDWADYFYPLFRSGVFNGHLQVVENEGMSIKIKPGYAWIDGYKYHLPEEMVIDLEMASGNMNRMDSIVIRLDLTNKWVRAFLKKGAYNAGTATPPAPEISATIHEIVIAHISVKSGTTKITQDMIKDTRMDKSICGWVCGAVEQIDFTQITAQFDAFFAMYRESIVEKFNEFLENADNYDAEFLAWIEEKKEEITNWQGKEVGDFIEWKESFIEELESWAHGKMEVWTNEILEWFQNIRDQLTDDPAMHLQEQIGSLGDLNTTAKNNLTAAVNEVNAKSGVTGVKGNAETGYQKGNVNITPASIGLGNVNNTKDADKNVASAKRLASRGIVAPETNRTFPAAAGLSMIQAYNNGYPNAYGNVISIYGQGAGELFMGWNGYKAPLYYRSIRDTTDPWTGWRRIAFEEDINDVINSCPILYEYGGFTVVNGERVDVIFDYSSGSDIVPVQYLLVIRVTNAKTGDIYGSTARLITIPKSEKSDAVIGLLTLAVSTNTGYTLTKGVEKLTVKADNGYSVEGEYYALMLGV